jgi:excinuclease ABC subunit B
VDTLERVEILRQLRLGVFDVLIGVNLLREGLDLPEVSLVAIIDADKEGFLRSERALVQTVGRAARNINGRVIMYADRITESMRKTMEETIRRRAIQEACNEAHGLTPQPLVKSTESIMRSTAVANRESAGDDTNMYLMSDAIQLAADPVLNYMSEDEVKKNIAALKKQMEKAAKDLDFMEAARLRDEMFAYQERLKK